MNISDHINRQELSERLDGDVELFNELAQIFIDDSVTLLEKIGQAIASADSSALGKAAHTLKGAVSNFSAQKAFELALALEKSGKAGELDKVDEQFAQLKQEIEQVKDALKAMMDEGQIV